MSDFQSNVAELRGLRSLVSSETVPQLRSTDQQPLLASERPRTLAPSYTSESIARDTPEVNLNTSLPDLQNSSVNEPDQQQESIWEIMSGSLFFTLSTVYGASSVVLGAFGAHGLKKSIRDPGRIANWNTAAHYQLVHSVALLATSIALPYKAQRVPSTLFLAGMTMFSGSIYLLVLNPERFKFLGPVTPIGGLCLIGGWIGLGVAGRRFIPLR